MTTYTWIGVSGPWTNASFWTVDGTSNGSVPGIGDDAIIAAAGTYTVTVSTVEVNNLSIADADATLQVNGIFQIDDNTASAGTINIGAGNILVSGSGTFTNTGSISIGSGAQLQLHGQYTATDLGTIVNTDGVLWLPGTLENSGSIFTASDFGTVHIDGVAVGGTLNLDTGFVDNGATLDAVTVFGTIGGNVSIEAGFAGSVELVGAGELRGGLNFLDSETVNSATIVTNNEGSVSAQASQTVTLGSGVTITASGSPFPGSFVLLGGGGTIVSDATIDVGAGLPQEIEPVGLVNGGLLEVLGGTVTLQFTTASNTGTILVNDGSVDSTVGLGGAGTVALTGDGTVEFDSSYDQQALAFAGADNLLRLSEIAGTNDTQGFAPGDTIEVVATPVSVNFTAGTLAVQAGTFTLGGFVMGGVPANALFAVSVDGSNNSFITETIPCFAAGAHLLTDDGEVRVEHLRVGHRVATLTGRLSRIVWLGQRHIDCRRPRPAHARPVRVHAGAFDRRLPARDLLLSPDHAVFVGGVLVPVRHLINGSTIVQEPVDEITYYHVELATHDVILAEGLPCESYLDTWNRAAFAVGDETDSDPVSVNRVAW